MTAGGRDRVLAGIRHATEPANSTEDHAVFQALEDREGGNGVQLVVLTYTIGNTAAAVQSTPTSRFENQLRTERLRCRKSTVRISIQNVTHVKLRESSCR